MYECGYSLPWLTRDQVSYSIDKRDTIEDDIANKFGSKFFMQRGTDVNLHLPFDHMYCAQVQGEMAVIGRCRVV